MNPKSKRRQEKWGRLDNEEFRNLYEMDGTRSMHRKMRNAYKILVRKP